MKVQNNSYLSMEQIQEQYLNQTQQLTKATTTEGYSFQEILNLKTGQGLHDQEQVKFSRHAANRMADRNIELSGNQLERLKEGTQKASAKGINDSLVLIDQLAFIVNIPNQTVITAMNQQEANENVFTNIDGAVIV